MLLENCPYPQDTRVRIEATALFAAGHQVTVIAPGLREQPSRETVGGVLVCRYRAPRSGVGIRGFLWEYTYAMIATALLSLRIFVRSGFDVVHAHNPPDTFVVIAAFYKLFGKRFVFDHHDLSPEMYHARFPQGSGLPYRALLWFEKLTFRLADRVISTNDSLRQIAIDRGNVTPDRITIVRNGPQLERIDAAIPDPKFRQRAAFVFGYGGEMGVQDGLDYLLRALKHLIEDLGRSDFHCVLIGDGDARPMLEATTRSLGLENHVYFTGMITQAELFSIIAATDICLDPDPSNPYNDRSTMVKMIEYMALSKPIVAFDLPEHRVSAGEAALYARPNNELDFATKIAALMDDPERRAAMGRIGRQRVEDDLAWSFQADRLVGLYSQLAEATRTRRQPLEGVVSR